MDRAAFLRTLSRRLRRGATPGPAPEAPVSRPPVTDAEETVRLFMSRAVEVRATVSRVATRAHAFEAVSDLLARRQDAALACPEDLRWPGVAERWTPDPRAATFGLGEADWGIAETGGVVFRHQGPKGRSYSLLPAAVGVLLPVSRILPDLAAVVREVTTRPLPACVTFMTGVSRSGDIAGVTCYGVHGPAEVFVWIVDDE